MATFFNSNNFLVKQRAASAQPAQYTADKPPPESEPLQESIESRRKRFPEDFKLAALAKLEKEMAAGDISQKRATDKVAADLGIGYSTLWRWKDSFTRDGTFYDKYAKSRKQLNVHEVEDKKRGKRKHASHEHIIEVLPLIHEKIEDRYWSISRACKKFQISNATYLRYRDMGHFGNTPRATPQATKNPPQLMKRVAASFPSTLIEVTLKQGARELQLSLPESTLERVIKEFYKE